MGGGGGGGGGSDAGGGGGGVVNMVVVEGVCVGVWVGVKGRGNKEDDKKAGQSRVLR